MGAQNDAFGIGSAFVASRNSNVMRDQKTPVECSDLAANRMDETQRDRHGDIRDGFRHPTDGNECNTSAIDVMKTENGLSSPGANRGACGVGVLVDLNG